MKHLPLLLFYLLLGFCFQFPSVAMRFWMMDDVKVTPAQMAAIMGRDGHSMVYEARVWFYFRFLSNWRS